MFTVLYLADRASEEPMEIQVLNGRPLETVIRTARQKVELFDAANTRAKKGPIGFAVENTDGDELYRWYSQVRL